MPVKKIWPTIKGWFLPSLLLSENEPSEKSHVPIPKIDTADKSNQEFLVYLKAALRLKNKVSACQLQVMSLKKLKEHIPNTEDFAKELRALIAEIIKRRLGPRDAYLRVNRDTYIILFENLNQEDAELECVLIIEEVLRHLLKDRHHDDKVDIRTITVDLDGKIRVDEVDLLDVIVRLLGEQASTEQQGSHYHAPIKDQEPLNIAFHGLSADLHLIYQPFWNVQRKVFSTYYCIATDGEKQGYDVLGRDPDRYLIPALDFLVIGRMMHELKRLQEHKIYLLLVCPVHIDTLCDPRSWPTYHALCHRLGHLHQCGQVIFEAHGVNEQTDPGVLAHALSKLTNYCRYTIIRAAFPIPAFVPPPECKLRSFSADLSAFDGLEKHKVMEQYTLAATALHKDAIITGLQSPSQVMSAAKAGFIQMSGDTIHAPLLHPDFIFQFESLDFLSKLSQPS